MFLCPARDPLAMAPGPRATALDLLAPPARTTGAPGGQGLARPSPGQREPDLGVTAGPRGAGHHGRPACALERVGNSSPAWDRARASASWPDVGRAPASAGDDDARL
jgi:hypothetical protein